MKYQMDSLRHLLNGIEYLTVTSPDTGKIWLDRNLGASQVCTSSTDSSCYGNLYNGAGMMMAMSLVQPQQ